MITDVKLTYNSQMKKLLSGDWVPQCLGQVAKEVLKATVGSYSIAHRHLEKRQGKWPRLANSTLRDPRKESNKIFVGTGNAQRAIKARPADGKINGWGKGDKRRLRYTANGLFSAAGVNKSGFWMMTGFAGKLNYSKEFKSKRRELAVKQGATFNGLSTGAQNKLINRLVSVSDTHKALKSKRGSGLKKYQAKSKTNLAYCDVVQAGRFMGAQTSAGFMDPVAFRKSGLAGAVIRKSPRPVFPYDQSDVPELQEAVEQGLADLLKKEFG